FFQAEDGIRDKLVTGVQMVLFRSEEPLAALSALYRDGGLTIAEGRPAIPTPVGRAVGGTTVINSGTCFRAPDSVLAGWRTEHGKIGRASCRGRGARQRVVVS